MDEKQHEGPARKKGILALAKAAVWREAAPDNGKRFMEGSLSTVQEFEDQLKKWSRKKMLKVVSGYVRDDPEAAEDIVQYAILRAYRSLLNGNRPYVVPRDMLEHLKRVDSGSQDLDLSKRTVKVADPDAWMYTILRNTARNYYRSKQRSEKKLRAIMSEAERLGSGIEHPEATAVRNLSNEELRRSVYTLPEPYSRIIAEHYFEEMKFREIAQELGYPASTVRVYARRALRMLRETVQPR